MTFGVCETDSTVSLFSSEISYIGDLSNLNHLYRVSHLSYHPKKNLHLRLNIWMPGDEHFCSVAWHGWQVNASFMRTLHNCNFLARSNCMTIRWAKGDSLTHMLKWWLQFTPFPALWLQNVKLLTFPTSSLVSVFPNWHDLKRKANLTFHLLMWIFSDFFTAL